MKKIVVKRIRLMKMNLKKERHSCLVQKFMNIIVKKKPYGQ